ncbi:hypothetical protein [Streptomyces sp. NPDC001652]|uniref:hypothetical protein n=1 Tax=Streptomyces sp. NPDC001652 TaxID=3154393 RepID=UPI003326FDBF
MNATEDGRPVDDYVCRFDFQHGWVDLTLSEATKAAARALATETLSRLNPLSLEVEKSAVFDDMVDRACELNEDGPILAGAYYAENGVGLADLKVDSFGEQGVPRPTPKDVQPLLLEWANAEVASEPDITYLDLAAGPAVRVQAMLKARRLFGFGRRFAEFVKYAVFPPGLNNLVVVTVTWQAIDQTEALTQLTDELVSTMRLVPVDADGNEITDPNPPK